MLAIYVAWAGVIGLMRPQTPHEHEGTQHPTVSADIKRQIMTAHVTL